MLPEPVIQKETAKIFDLQEPSSKMSKSASNDKGVIWMLDDPAASAKKIKSATTDSDGEVRFDAAGKPGISNLLTMHSSLSGESDRDPRGAVRRARVRRLQGRGG